MTVKEAIEIIRFLPVYRYESDFKTEDYSDLFLALDMAVNIMDRIPEKRQPYLGITDFWDGWIEGWNDCIDEILGN